MRKWKKPALWVIASLLLLAGFIAFILPGIVKDQAVKGIERATGRKAAIAEVSLNPLTWTARVDGFRLMEKGSGVTFASFSSARVTISPQSVFRLAPIVASARLSAPYLHVVRTSANTYNFSDLLEGNKEPKAKGGKSSRFSVNNITISNGSIDFLDQALPQEKVHQLRHIEIGVPFISNIKYLAERYVQPRFSALVNGAPLHLEGKLKPFMKGAETSFTVNLKDLSLPYYLSYYPGKPPVQMDTGRLSTALEIVHRVTAGNNPELEVKGKVVLEEIASRDQSGAQLLSLARGEARISRVEVMGREFALSALAVDGLELNVVRDRQGKWNFQQITGEARQEQGPKAEATPAKKPLISVGDISLSRGIIHFSDSMPRGGFTTDVRDLNFVMQGFSTAPGRKAAYTLSFATARGETGKVIGDLSLDPLTADTTVECRDILLDAYYPYLAEQLTAPIKGKLDIVAGAALTPGDGLVLNKLEIETRQMVIPFGKDEGVKLAKIALRGGKGSLKARSLEVESVSLENGTIRVSRDAKGGLSPLALLRETKKPAVTAKEKKGEKKENEPPFRYLVKGINGAGLAVTFVDRMKEDEPAIKLRNLRFSLANITGPRFSPMPFRVAAAYGNKGTISASGSVNPKPLKLKGECALRGIPLADFDAYLPDNLNVTIADGKLDTRLAINLAESKGQLSGSFRGGLGIRSFYTLDADNEDLLKWESLQIDDLAGTLAPFSLKVADVALSRCYSRIVVDKSGTLNLQQLRAPEQKEETPQQAAPPPQKPSPPPQAAPAGPGKIEIGTVTMQDGTIVFIDHHTSPEYSSTMVNLGGRVSGLTSAADKLADVDLRGNLENHSPLRITGQINPLRDNLFADLTVSFTDIELSPLTPYSGTYLGYAVDKGKLFLDLKYKIENKKLDSSNKVFIDQLTFGNKVESDKATALPVRLAVALLKDR